MRKLHTSVAGENEDGKSPPLNSLSGKSFVSLESCSLGRVIVCGGAYTTICRGFGDAEL